VQPRFNYGTFAPDAMAAMGVLDTVSRGPLDESLLNLIKLRASQINGCGYCVDMHTKDARESGEREQRLYALSVWRESPFYTDREKAALQWTESLTLIADGQAADSVYEEVSEHFSELELSFLTFSIVTINAWNRLAISARDVPGSYKPSIAR
jgi:AhpD family alkylhydroperoxidase